jgi:hypothetical protein
MSQDEDAEFPEEKRGWLNKHYHFIWLGESTAHTDFRKAIKPKTPKAKAKIKVRPSVEQPAANPQGSAAVVSSTGGSQTTLSEIKAWVEAGKLRDGPRTEMPKDEVRNSTIAHSV